MAKKYTPRGLSAEAQKLYRETVREAGLDVIDDSASLTLLENACRALMRLRLAEKVVRAEGSTITDRFGQVKPHPAVSRIDAEGLALRQSLGAVKNHQVAAAYKRMELRRNGAGAGEPDPQGRIGARHEAI